MTPASWPAPLVAMILVKLSNKLYLYLKFRIMEILTVGEFKAKFSEVLQRVLAGEEIAISYGRNRKVVACLVPKTPGKKQRRKLGILEGKGTVRFSKDFKITAEELLHL